MMPRMPARFFCAVCGEDIGNEQPAQAPLGRERAMVNVCADCNPANAITRLPAAGATRPAYEIDRSPSVSGGSFRKAVEAGERAIYGAGYAAEMDKRKREGLTPAPPLTNAERDLREYDAESVRRIRTTANQYTQRKVYTRERRNGAGRKIRNSKSKAT